MASLFPDNAVKVLEPTAGKGNLVSALQTKGEVICPKDFYTMKKQHFD